MRVGKVGQDYTLQDRVIPHDTSISGYDQGLKWGRVAWVGDPAPFDLPGL